MMVTVTFSDDFKRDAVAQITERGYKRRPGSYGGKPSVVVGNTLDRQFDVEAPDWVW
ncbi:hypothetical protein H0485_12470, partial [Pseudogemmobacter sp. CC-YST710]|nr:hypothetical protein [Pseudogemmobacter faecipullorum]